MLKIINKLRYLINKLSDEQIKNWNITNFISNHTILISLPIILIGLFFIFYSNYSDIEINRLEIRPDSAFSIRGSPTYDHINKSEISINIISILIKYNKPLMRRNSFEINEIMLYTPYSEFDNVDDVTLHLKGRDSRIFTDHDKSEFPHVFTFSKNDPESYELQPPTIFSLFSQVVSPSYEDSEFILYEPNSTNHFNFNYFLKYNESGKEIEISGNVKTLYPIKCSTDVEVFNIQTNKSILFLTGILIILGSFPFSLALKHLLKRNNKIN